MPKRSTIPRNVDGESGAAPESARRTEANASASASGSVDHATHIGGAPATTVHRWLRTVSSVVPGSKRSTSTIEAPAKRVMPSTTFSP